MLNSEQVREIREKFDRLHSAHAPHMVRRLLADRAEITQELERIQANAVMASREQTINELTALIERIKA